MSPRYFNDRENKFRDWWKELHGIEEYGKKRNMRGERAHLRRAETPGDVMLSSAYYALFYRLPPERSLKVKTMAVAIIAGILSHIENEVTEKKEDDPQKRPTFAKQLGSPKEQGDNKPVMSELRFQKLAKSNTPEEFYRLLIRAVKMLGKTVHISSLVDNIYHWVTEHHYGKDQRPENRLVVQWAGDYFEALSKIENKKEK